MTKYQDIDIEAVQDELIEFDLTRERMDYLFKRYPCLFLYILENLELFKSRDFYLT